MKRLSYSEEQEYLVAAIMHLAVYERFWARSPSEMAKELSLDETRLERVLQGFKGLFRESTHTETTAYALQARYALREQGAPVTARPLSEPTTAMLLTLVMQAAAEERRLAVAEKSGNAAKFAALISAIAAIAAAIIAYFASAT